MATRKNQSGRRRATARLLAALAWCSLVGVGKAAPPSLPAVGSAVLALAPDAPRWDDAKLAEAGIRKVTGKHLTLYTDLPPGKEVDELPAVFDLAVPQWADYFRVEPARLAPWHMTGYVIKDKALFTAQRLLPRDLPEFTNGYQRGGEFWVYEQPSPYYRRHLILHEGTHAFMNLVLGGSGAPWYSEGMAELFGTHRYEGGKLQTRYFPKSKVEAPYWGRIRLLKDELAAGRGKSLVGVMQYGPRAHLQVEPYAWCWAAAALLDGHPRYREKFRELVGHVREQDAEFSRRFYEQLKEQWPELSERWQLFVRNIEYGYDIPRAAVQFKPGRSLPAGGATVAIAADRGWQSTGVRLDAGTTYRIAASGRYQVADQPKIWWCEPGGVTIRYFNGRPLGMLVAALRDDAFKAGNGRVSPLVQTAPIGLGRSVTPRRAGTLYLKINDSPGELADNAGQITVRITAR